MEQKPSKMFIVFIVLMVLIILCGVFMMVYGSMHNGLPAPRLPGTPHFARGLFHG